MDLKVLVTDYKNNTDNLIELKDVDSSKVLNEVLLSTVPADQYKESECNMHAVYNGSVLNTRETVQSLEIPSNSFVHLLLRPNKSDLIEPMIQNNQESNRNLFYNLKKLKTINWDEYDRLVNENAISKFVKCAPNASKNPLYSEIIQDSKMIKSLISSSESINSLISDHPLLAELLNCISSSFPSIVNNNFPGRNREGDLMRIFGGNDNESSDENEDDPEPSSSSTNFIRPFQASRRAPPPISSNALRQALFGSLQTAAGTTTPADSQQPERMDTSNSANVSQASMTSSDIPAPAVSLHEKWAAQVEQLKEMGVTDIDTAVQALDAANGDINMAFQILFS